MLPTQWGQGKWKFMHTAASQANTPEKRKDFVDYVIATAKVIPCDQCKDHFGKNMQKYPIQNYMQSAEMLFAWTFIMHDEVNISQGKTGVQRPSFKTVFNQYFNNTLVHDTSKIDVNDEASDICSSLCDGVEMKQGFFISSSKKNKNIYF